MRAMILAAGYGTRLWPLTADRAKAAVPFLNRPLISYSLEFLEKFGIHELMINLHHHPESVEAAVRKYAPAQMKVHFSVEKDILGTGGALDRVRPFLQDATFVVMNGKIVTEINLAGALEAHRRRSALATLVLRPNSTGERYSQVTVDNSGRILGFSRHSLAEAADDPPRRQPPLMFTGVQVLEPGIFDYIPPGRFSHTTTEAYPDAIAHKEAVIGHIDTGSWFELSTLERYLTTHLRFLGHQGQSSIFGSNTIVEPGAEVNASVLWDNVRVETGASLDSCIVGDGVVVPAKTRFKRAAVVRAEHCQQIDRGELRGENLVVPF